MNEVLAVILMTFAVLGQLAYLTAAGDIWIAWEEKVLKLPKRGQKWGVIRFWGFFLSLLVHVTLGFGGIAVLGYTIGAWLSPEMFLPQQQPC